MEDCPFTNRLDAYHDGELRPAERSAFEAHLGGCCACARALEFRRRLSAALRGRPASAPDETALRALILRSRAVPARARQQDLARLGWGLSAAAAAALAVGLLFPRERTARAAGHDPDDWTRALAEAAARVEVEAVAEEDELVLAILEGLDGRVARGDGRGR